MLVSGRVRACVALFLTALLGVLGTGLPSHSHATGDVSNNSQPVIEAEHHGHGTVLVEQDDRVLSVPFEVAVPAAVGLDIATPVARAMPQADRNWLHPRERSPPQATPRAPPPLL